MFRGDRLVAGELFRHLDLVNQPDDSGDVSNAIQA